MVRQLTVWIFLVLCLVGGLLLKDGEMHQAGPPPRGVLPRSSPPLSSREIPLSLDEVARLGSAYAERRAYSFKGKVYLVTYLDGSRDPNLLHSPVQCLLGEGWEVGYRDTLSLASGRARLVKLRAGDRSMDLLYWYQRSHPSASKLGMMADAALYQVTRGSRGHRPVLMSVLASSTSTNEWQALTNELIPGFLPRNRVAED